MTNQEVRVLLFSGVLDATALTLPAKSAYKLYKFQKSLRKAIETIQESEKELATKAGIDDTSAFDARMEELRKIETPTEAEEKEIAEMNQKLSAFNEMRFELYKEDADVTATAMVYEDWHELKKENHTKDRDIFSPVETLLEGILWLAPEE